MGKSRKNVSLEDLRVGLRFVTALPGFLRSTLTPTTARHIVKARLSSTGSRVLALLGEIYSGGAESPYRRLLESCGAELGDLEALLGQDGVEGLLRALLDQGVYLRADEFKARVPVRRGSLEFIVNPLALINPAAVVHGISESSGSTGPRTPVPIDLRFIADHAVNTLLAMQAYGGIDWAHGHHGLPGGTALTNPLEMAKFGRSPERWFTTVHPNHPELNHRYRWSGRAARLGARLGGAKLPPPTMTDVHRPLEVIQWMQETLAQGRVPHLWTFASTAVQVAITAGEIGANIAGARFTAGGEPTSPERRRIVEQSGAVMLPRMGATETDILAYACLRPNCADDMHFFDDRHALIQAGEDTECALPGKALLLTTLLESAPLRMLNVCMGDQARIVRRQCGCPMSDFGWHTHLEEVRSFEKLTAGGMAFLDYDVIRILEEVLPQRFGGSAADFQIVERLDQASSRFQIELRASPALGPIEAGDLRAAFLDALCGGSEGQRLGQLWWQDGQVISEVRKPPLRTASGKVLHLHRVT